MAGEHMEALVCLCSDDWLGGYVRWFCDRPATHSYHSAVVFHAAGPMTLIDHGPLRGRRDVAGDPDFPGIGDLLTTAAWQSVNYTHSYEANLVCGEIARRGYTRVGVVGLGAMPHAVAESLARCCPTIIDATEFVNCCEAIKSDVEIEEIKSTAAMQDDIFEAVLRRIEPGMRGQDVTAIAQYEGRVRGSEQGIYLASSAPMGRPTLLASPHYQARRIASGEHFTLLIENNGPSGYYTELGRTIVLGEPSQDLHDATALAVEAQRATAARLLPSATCAAVAAAHDDFMDSHGLSRETRLFAHGQGYDLVERPMVRADDPGRIEAGMNFVVHPSFVRNGAFGFMCDNFIVRASGGAVRLHRTEQRVFETQ